MNFMRFSPPVMFKDIFVQQYFVKYLPVKYPGPPSCANLDKSGVISLHTL